MKKDEIIKIADEFFTKDEIGLWIATDTNIEEFANLVAKKQSEKCAFLCSELYRKMGWDANAGYASDCIKKRFL